jgi:hypothetical protein
MTVLREVSAAKSAFEIPFSTRGFVGISSGRVIDQPRTMFENPAHAEELNNKNDGSVDT